MPLTTRDIKNTREKLHRLIDEIDEESLFNFYTLLAHEFGIGESEFSTEWKNEVDRRTEKFNNGESPLISAEESKRRIEGLLG